MPHIARSEIFNGSPGSRQRIYSSVPTIRVATFWFAVCSTVVVTSRLSALERHCHGSGLRSVVGARCKRFRRKAVLRDDHGVSWTSSCPSRHRACRHLLHRGVRQLRAVAHLRHRLLYIPQIARIVRANVMSEYNQDYVRAVVVSGARAPWICGSTLCATAWLPSSCSPSCSWPTPSCSKPPWPSSAPVSRAHPHLGQHPGRRPQRRAGRRWWQALFPGIMI